MWLCLNVCVCVCLREICENLCVNGKNREQKQHITLLCVSLCVNYQSGGSESLFIHSVTHICSPERLHQKPYCPPPLAPFTSISLSLHPPFFPFSSLTQSLSLSLLGLFISQS